MSGGAKRMIALDLRAKVYDFSNPHLLKSYIHSGTIVYPKNI
jgi:hypothetical protein